MDKTKTIQHLIGVHTAAEAVALEALHELKNHLGANADAVFTAIHDKLSEQYKNSDIAPAHELSHADIVRPVLDEIKRLIETAKAR